MRARPDGSRRHNGPYVEVKVAGRWVYEHRHVMEQVLGRRLRRGEVVHHRTGSKADNRPENLRLKRSQAAHMEDEHKDRGRGVSYEAWTGRWRAYVCRRNRIIRLGRFDTEEAALAAVAEARA